MEQVIWVEPYAIERLPGLQCESLVCSVQNPWRATGVEYVENVQIGGLEQGGPRSEKRSPENCPSQDPEIGPVGVVYAEAVGGPGAESTLLRVQ